MQIPKPRLLSLVFAAALAATSASGAVERGPAFGSLSESHRAAVADDIDQMLQVAFQQYSDKRYDEALATCARAAEQSPDDFRPPTVAGLIYLAQFKMKSASDQFAKSISLKPDRKQTYLLKAQADRFRNAKDEAIAACRKALELDPKYAEAYAMIGETLRFDEKRRSEAVAAFRTAIEINPSLTSAYGPLGQLLAESKDAKTAEWVFRQAMGNDPKRMAGRFELGRLFVEQERLKEARELWEARTSSDDNTFPNFIELLERAERMKRATDELALKPDDPAVLVRVGEAVMDGNSWVVDGRQERAIVHFRKALKLRPGYAEAQFAIVKAYVQIADTYKAKNKDLDAELTKLRSLDPRLATEAEEYRKTYSGGLKAGPPAPVDK